MSEIEKAVGEKSPAGAVNGGQPGSDPPNTTEASAVTIPTKGSVTVAGIEVGKTDSRNQKIDFVYFKRSRYAIYLCGSKVVVQYADDDTEATKQIGALAELIPLRDRLQYLVPAGGDEDAGRSKDAECYRPQIAEALRLGLEDRGEMAKRILDAAIQDVLDARARVGRMFYLKFAGPLAIVIAGVLIALAFGVPKLVPAKILMIATAGGAIGALLSISIAIRARTVATDGDISTNALDGTIRVFIGVVSAAVLYLFLESGMLKGVTFGEATIQGGAATIGAAVGFLIGFAAGFLERLVPDLLEKNSSVAGRAVGGSVPGGSTGTTTR
jgi:hypothetical protein